MAKLVVISKSHAGLSYSLGRHWVTIGRNPGNVFPIVESSVSGQHCEVRLQGDSLEVRDMRSTNGTFIKGTMVTEGVVRLGEILRLGEIELRLEPVEPKTAPDSRNGSPHDEGSSNNNSLSPNTSGNKRHVLLVDDSMALLETAAELFEDFANGTWEVHKACGADQALQLIQQHQIEIAALDINMPMLDGVQLLGMIHRRHPEVKKVILTGMANEAHRAHCLANGAELFLEKPTTRDGFRFVFNVLNDLLTWNQQEGFSGTLQQVGLTDIIQIECLRRSSCILEIHNAQAQGEIFIESGMIVHASSGGIVGEKALHALLSLNYGRFHLYPYRQPSGRTIQGSWEWLLMESARVQDEEKGARAGDKTVVITRSEMKSGATESNQTLPKPAVAPQETKTAPPAGTGELETPELSNEFVVISTYDGKWKPTNNEK